MRTLIQDVRYALRLFAKHPGMTAVAVLSLGLATGPNAAIFSVVNTLFFQGMAVEKPGELVDIAVRKDGRGELLTHPDYVDLAEGSRAFSSVVVWERHISPISVRGWEELCPSNTVSVNYFQGLGVRPAIGRLFTPELDSKPSGDVPAVISYSLWQRRFGGSPDVLNQKVQMLNRNLLIVGVAPQRFRGMSFHMPVDVWLPLTALSRPADLANRDRGTYNALGRLRPGATIVQARAELDVAGKRLAELYPATNKGRAFTGFAYAKHLLTVGLVLGGIALGLVSLVLLVACANVAGLLLAQAEARRREIAVRLSLGAGRWRLVRQLLTESVVLGLMGGGAGLLFGYWLLHLPIQPPMGFSLDYGIRLDWRMFAYAILISAATALLFGLAPALRASKRDLVTELKADRGETARGRRFFSMRNILVVGQIAVSQFLLAGTVLWVRSYMNVQSVRPGFDQERNVIFAHLATTAAANAKMPGPAAYQELIERLRGLPGVVEVSSAAAIPLSGSGDGIRQKVLVPGDAKETPVRNNFVAPRYFAVMGTRLLRGRDFDARDAAVGKSIIVNESLAKRLAPSSDVVGRWFRVEGVEREVIGVVEDGKYSTLREAPVPFMYLPTGSPSILAVATAGSSTAVSEALRRTVTQAVPQLRVLSFVTLKQNMRFATYLDAMAAALLGTLGLLGIFLAAAGLYGVVAAAVERRTREIGIRVAIGAEPRKVVRMVLGDGLRLAVVGVGIGLAAAVAGAIAISSMLFGVKPADPLSYLCGAFVVVAIAVLASHVPARRASRVDPAVALRSE